MSLIAWPHFSRDERGVVYLEFLAAFGPVFLLFLGICQMTFITTARLVVRHAALAAARSAVVVLEEPPEDYGGADRGSVSQGSGNPAAAVGRLLVAFEGDPSVLAESVVLGAVAGSSAPQQGARMAPIETAAYMPLLTLAPAISAVTGSSVRTSIPSAGPSLSAFEYTREATTVTLPAAPGSAALSAEPIGRTANVTVRVTYVFACTVPFVRMLLCSSLDPKSSWPVTLLAWSRLGGRFEVLEAEATLPNQGAAYYGGS